MHLRGISMTALLFALLLADSTAFLNAQQSDARKIDSLALEKAHAMLRQTYDEIRKNYYDPTFHGVDLDKTYEQYNARMDQSKTPNETFRVIAAFTNSLNDSHTFFMPPMRANPSTPGFAMEMIGDKCFITRIRPGTDAATKLHVGDQVLALNGFNVELAHFHDMVYFIQTLSPAPVEVLDLLSPTGEHRQETIQAKLRKGVKVLDLEEGDGSNFWKLVREEEEDYDRSKSRGYETGDTFIWRVPSFAVPFPDVDSAVGKAMKYKNLIIDLRGNSGGYEETLKAMLGHFFDHEVKLADVVTRVETKKEKLGHLIGREVKPADAVVRTETKPVMINPRKPFYTGNVIVIVDHNSASSAELFPRVIQLEHRGKVIGDNSAGAVMEARQFGESTGTNYLTIYGLSITHANMLMTDGKSLENVGVIPDELLLPTAQDLAAGKDPVLSHAAALTGVKLDPVAAGKLFPFEWPEL
jgi:carboxyl-terminal processing protease